MFGLALAFAHLQRPLANPWIGRQVWVFGGMAYASEDLVIGWDPSLPVRIIGIKPAPNDNDVGDTPPPIALMAGSNDWPESHWDVELQLPKQRKWVHINSGGEDYWLSWPVPAHAVLHISDPKTIWWYASTESPFAVLSKESARIREAFQKGRVVKGMPRSLVIRLLGFPMDRPSESYARMMTERQWYYVLATPFDYEVDFDASGRVTDERENGTMP